MAGVVSSIVSFLGSIGTSAGVGTATASGLVASTASVATGAVIVGGTAAGLTAGVKSLKGDSLSGAGAGAGDAATQKARKEAEQRSLLETRGEEKKSAARRALLNTPTSGFGPNTNLARSFLTSL